MAEDIVTQLKKKIKAAKFGNLDQQKVYQSHRSRTRSGKWQGTEFEMQVSGV